VTIGLVTEKARLPNVLRRTRDRDDVDDNVWITLNWHLA